MRRTWIPLLACLALLAAACGDDGGETGSATSVDAATTTTAAAAGEGEGTGAGEVPQRIVSLSATATEVLFAIGAGDQVVAVDELSDFPEGAPVTDLSGYEPSLEAIAAYDPDLVVSSYDPGDLVSGLDAIGVEVVNQPPPATLAEAYDQMVELGEATGHPEEAAELVADLQARIEAATDGLDGATSEPISVYHEVDATFYSASSNSFLGELYALVGLANIADGADTGGSGFPQLSAEYIIEADPDLIVITDEGGYSPADVAARPGWDAITAVASGDVLQVDADLPSRWGPRVADFVELLADHVSEMQAG